MRLFALRLFQRLGGEHRFAVIVDEAHSSQSGGTTSRQLKDALGSGKTIIVTTLQKFGAIVNEIQDLSGKRLLKLPRRRLKLAVEYPI